MPPGAPVTLSSSNESAIFSSPIAMSWDGHVNILKFFLVTPQLAFPRERHGSVKGRSIGRSVISTSLTALEVGTIPIYWKQLDFDYEEEGIRAVDERRGCRNEGSCPGRRRHEVYRLNANGAASKWDGMKKCCTHSYGCSRLQAQKRRKVSVTLSHHC
jgi:hypothetical protein